MDTLLIAVTALSLLMAAAMAVVVLKLLHDERLRSDARVAALAEMAMAGEAARGGAYERQVGAAPAADLDLRPTAVAGVADMFAQPERPSPWGRRFAVIAALGTVAVTTGLLLFRTSAATPMDRAPHVAATAPSAEPVPLALMSLRHTQEPDSLTITGLVQNPRGAAPLSRVVVTAFAFDAGGTFLASSRAPLDFTSLGPGDESPFVVSIPVTGGVARYRVGFRTEDGRVLAHLDKRSETLAQK